MIEIKEWIEKAGILRQERGEGTMVDLFTRILAYPFAVFKPG